MSSCEQDSLFVYIEVPFEVPFGRLARNPPQYTGAVHVQDVLLKGTHTKRTIPQIVHSPLRFTHIVYAVKILSETTFENV